MSIKKFDLNIEKILEDWEIYHAIREVIANALDEQLLTNTKDIEIFKDKEGRWHIRDYGRGLRYEHLTQKEDEEKLENPNTIGKFGIGLKDALATYDRKGVKVIIKSKYGCITLTKSPKHDFGDVITLHAEIHPVSDQNLQGTEFILIGIKDEDIKKAKDLFLRFSGERIIEKTKYGTVLEKKSKIGRIYINGVKVAEEENFLFSYNITSLTAEIKKALNRERTNVGRNAYRDRIKSILLSCEDEEVANDLMKDLEKYESGLRHDELKWIDVQVHAVKMLNSLKKKVLFLTPGELMTSTDMVDEAKSSGYKIITIPENLKDKVENLKDSSGNPIRILNQFQIEYAESFEFKFINPEEFSSDERKIFESVSAIFELIGGKPRELKEIKISETMRKDFQTFQESVGLWDEKTQSIIIKRTQLKKLQAFAGTLLHEVAHILSGDTDVSRAFESELTKLLGKIIAKVIG